jgi:hypothetical protein
VRRVGASRCDEQTNLLENWGVGSVGWVGLVGFDDRFASGRRFLSPLVGWGGADWGGVASSW